MKKEELWQRFVERYPKFADEDHVVKLTARGLKRMVETAYETGHDQGVRNGKALAAMKEMARGEKPPGFLGGLFG